jgi:hypothetical protein
MKHSEIRPCPAATRPTTITVTIPLKLSRRGGRKTVISPVPYVSRAPKYDNALIKALARAHRWRRLIESGHYGSITELARSEKVNQSYACRLLRLTLLAPNIVEAILNGTHSHELQLNRLVEPIPVDWDSQVRQLSISDSR